MTRLGRLSRPGLGPRGPAQLRRPATRMASPSHCARTSAAFCSTGASSMTSTAPSVSSRHASAGTEPCHRSKKRSRILRSGVRCASLGQGPNLRVPRLPRSTVVRRQSRRLAPSQGGPTGKGRKPPPQQANGPRQYPSRHSKASRSPKSRPDASRGDTKRADKVASARRTPCGVRPRRYSSGRARFADDRAGRHPSPEAGRGGRARTRDTRGPQLRRRLYGRHRRRRRRMPGTLGAIGSALGRIGAGWSDVTDVVLTHSHFDHVGGLAETAMSAPKAALWAGRLDVPAIRLEGRRVVRPLSEGHRVRDLVVLNSPGHTPGHISLLHESASLVLVGDLVGSIDGRLTFGPPAFTADRERSRASLARMVAAGRARPSRLLARG